MKSAFKNTLTIIIFFILFYSSSPIFAQWQKFVIDGNLTGAAVISIDDFDKDNDVDIVASGELSNEVVLYENNFPDWTKHIIDNSLHVPVGVNMADIDSDDKLDIIAAGRSSDNIYWYENNHPIWTKHLIDENIDEPIMVIPCDIDFDDDLDVFVQTYLSKSVVWYENYNLTWTKHIIEQGEELFSHLDVVDMDGDDTLDIVLPSDLKVVWFKNISQGSKWEKFVIDGDAKGPWTVSSDDLDGNGTHDVAVVGSSVNGLVWYENNHPLWPMHSIDSQFEGGYNCVHISDLNGDKKNDVVATNHKNSDVFLYKNNLPNEWGRILIDNNLNGAYYPLTGDIDGDSVDDLVLTAWTSSSGSVTWYKNPFTTSAFGMTINCMSRYVPLETNVTLHLVAKISNPEFHETEVFSSIETIDSVIVDSIKLYDDGLHNDGISSDNIFGTLWEFSNPIEEYYEINLFTRDMNDSFFNICPNKGYFTTAGPVAKESYVIEQLNDSLYMMKIVLQNHSTSFTVSDVTARISTTDSNITKILSGGEHPQFYPDIGPGNSVQNIGLLGYRFYVKNDPAIVNFTLDIYSDKIHYWTDSILVDLLTDMEDGLLNLPKEFTLKQNYPNPFNPTTTIKYSIPKQSNVTLKVYDVLGNEVATLINKEQSVGNYEIEFGGSELTSGIYFYRLQSGDFVETKKMILLK